MKRILIFAVVLIATFAFKASAGGYYNEVGGYFYSQLSPYGSWIEVDYGVIVWRPTIIRVNWSPYQMGRWIWTSDGWYWDSYEPFGYITYHYGRWYHDDYYGWLWYPDYEWAPAWVEWRYDNNYIGWAPLNPYAVFSVSVGIYYTTTYYTPYYYWNYVTYRNFCDPYVYNYYVVYGSKYRIHKGTKYRNNFVYYNGRIQNRGVDIKYVRVRSGNEIKQRDVIRVTDSRELTRDKLNNRDEIRTLDMNRNELMRNDLSRMEIKRENRKTSIDMEKVQIGRRENVTTEVRKDNSKERNVNATKTSQIRNDVKIGVDKVFQESRDNTKTNPEINSKNDKIESTQRKVNTTKKDVSVSDQRQVKKQSQTNSNRTVELNRQQNNRTNEVKKENARVNTNDQAKSTVRDQNRTQSQNSKSVETKQNSDRTKDNSQDRKRR